MSSCCPGHPGDTCRCPEERQGREVWGGAPSRLGGEGYALSLEVFLSPFFNYVFFLNKKGYIFHYSHFGKHKKVYRRQKTYP